jgi:hypothetical protein
MAIIEAISSKANIKRIIRYVTQDNKTNINLITGKDCMAESCLEEMLYTKNLYHKNSGRQYIHIIQSFDPRDNLSAEQVHNIGIKLTNIFNGFQVLVATHIDKNHLHNHLVINSVSFENGYKIQMSKEDLQYIKNYSDKLCLEIGVSVIPKKEKTNYIKRNEYRVAEQGKSWKFKLINAIDLSLAESNCKDVFIKNMNKLGYQVNWIDTRKYITYTTPEGYKCRDNKLYDEKYSKGAMENEFRRIEKEQSNSTRKSGSSINSKDGVLSNRTRDSKGFISNGTSNSRRYNNYEKESTRYTGKVIKRQYSNERGNEKIGRGKIERSILQLEARIERNGRGTEKQDFQNKMENRVNNILGGIIAISNMVSNSQVNNRPKRRIRRYRTLSKQAMKEYAMKKANSSSFDWFEDEEEM